MNVGACKLIFNTGNDKCYSTTTQNVCIEGIAWLYFKYMDYIRTRMIWCMTCIHDFLCRVMHDGSSKDCIWIS